MSFLTRSDRLFTVGLFHGLNDLSFPRLQHLSCNQTSVSVSDIDRISQCCSNLRYLDISNLNHTCMSHDSDSIDIETSDDDKDSNSLILDVILTRLSSLRYFNMSNFEQHVIVNRSMIFMSLQHLEIAQTMIDDDDLINLLTHSSSSESTSGDTLIYSSHHVNNSSSESSCGDTLIYSSHHVNNSSLESTSGDTLIYSSHRVNRLTHLNINSLDNISNRSLHEIIQSCHKLEYLDISYCINLSMNVFSSLSTSSFPCLTDFDCSNTSLNDRDVFHLVSSCRKLKILNISYMMNVTNDSILSICSYTSRLQQLGIDCCVNITGNAFDEINEESLPYLERLSCDPLVFTDEILKHIAKYCINMLQVNNSMY